MYVSITLKSKEFKKRAWSALYTEYRKRHKLILKTLSHTFFKINSSQNFNMDLITTTTSIFIFQKVIDFNFLAECNFSECMFIRCSPWINFFIFNIKVSSLYWCSLCSSTRAYREASRVQELWTGFILLTFMFSVVFPLRSPFQPPCESSCCSLCCSHFYF